MPAHQLRYSLEEHARLGEEIYQKKVRPLVEEGNQGKIVAIDVDTGEFEVADELGIAGDRLYERLPDAQPFCIRIGSPAVDRFSYFPPERC